MNSERTNFDLLYNPRLTVAEFPQIIERWQRESERARAALSGYLEVPYGPDEGETMDIFRARGASRGLLMFIHGGYWRANDKKDVTFIAPALTNAGITVAIPNYALCPQVRVRDIVMQMVQACAWIYRNGGNFGAPPNRLYLCGHSAGGHLAAMMLACVWPVYARDLPAKPVQAAMSVSGLYDLRDIVKAGSVNCDVRLTEESALEVSPAFLPPATDAPLYTAVGERENEGFHIQNRLIAARWNKVHRADLVCAGENHFTALDQFADSNSRLFRAVLAMMGI
ncbi:MAG: alpha/beta hydrolase [Betaproteobacteria bacterium]|nr:alpha/beta hydrolase [Betaproteobacteria bacterium]MBI2959668.1 alpha/beta hydrolase [Betaproteobacteria bacterium]